MTSKAYLTDGPCLVLVIWVIDPLTTDRHDSKFAVNPMKSSRLQTTQNAIILGKYGDSRLSAAA